MAERDQLSLAEALVSEKVGRNPMLGLALAGITVAIIYTEVMRLTRGFKGLQMLAQPGTSNRRLNAVEFSGA